MGNVNHIKDYRQRLKERLVYVFGGKCQKCGYNKCLSALEFHHINPDEKEFMVTGSTVHNWNKVLEESKKCALLCANCHREYHTGLFKIDFESGFNQERANEITKKVEGAKQRQLFYCQDCGKEITRPKKGKMEYRCSECAAKNRRTVERPDRKELKQLVRNNPILSVGRIFNVTDNTIRKWLKAENLPYKKKDIDAYSNEEWDLI